MGILLVSKFEEQESEFSPPSLQRKRYGITVHTDTSGHIIRWYLDCSESNLTHADAAIVDFVVGSDGEGSTLTLALKTQET